MRQAAEQALIDAIDAALHLADAAGEALAAVHLSQALDAVGAASRKCARDRRIQDMRIRTVAEDCDLPVVPSNSGSLEAR